LSRLEVQRTARERRDSASRRYLFLCTENNHTMLSSSWWQWCAVGWLYCRCFEFGSPRHLALAQSLPPPLGVPNLPLGDIQVLVLTDTHSWVGGHGDKEGPGMDADYGDVLSFYRQLQQQLAGRNLFFVMNGDWIDGTGLALNGDASYLIPILERMPWDLLNVGNHELYDSKVIDFVSKPAGFLDWWGPKYLSSNIIRTNNQVRFGNPYRLLKGPTATLLSFGFLYDMTNNDPSVTVQQVETVVEQPWFTDALRTPGVDAILVLAHMDHNDPLVKVILGKIRQVLGDSMPVQFITGHTHYRGFDNPDGNSASFEAGRFLDTVGFVSFPLRSSVINAQPPTGGAEATNATALFQHVFLDSSRQVLQETLNGPELGTAEGDDLTDFIRRIQTELGLRQVVGCIEERYYLERGITAEQSLWGLFTREVVPRTFEAGNIVLFSTAAARYDLLPGDLILDEVIGMYPFNETVYSFVDVPIEILLELNSTLNAQKISYMPELPPYTFAAAGPLATANSTYNLVTSSFAKDSVHTQLLTLYPQVQGPVALPTTTLEIWLSFFRNEHLCQTSQQGNHREHNQNGRHNHTGGIPHMGIPSVPDEKRDLVRLIFAGVAFASVVLLGAVRVWQRGLTWRTIVSQSEQATLQAWEEFEDEEGRFV
jgi:2',3'-cyclic-nucleotide 2'-phosphodiesterase (5'-nucleotidase family)